MQPCYCNMGPSFETVKFMTKWHAYSNSKHIYMFYRLSYTHTKHENCLINYASSVTLLSSTSPTHARKKATTFCKTISISWKMLTPKNDTQSYKILQRSTADDSMPYQNTQYYTTDYYQHTHIYIYIYDL